MAEVPPSKRDAAAASEEPETNKKQKTTEGGTGLKRADGSPWEPITGTLVPIVGGKEGLKQVRDAAWPWHFKLTLASQLSTRGTARRRRRAPRESPAAPAPRRRRHDHATQEWTMIELQGDLIKKTETFDNQKLGDLEVRDGTPFLTIGIHELEGEFVTLKKPFVVLDPQQDEDETVTTCRGVECRSKFTVAGVIRRKVLFKLRPRVLVQRAAGPAEVMMEEAATATASELTPKDVVS